MADEKSAAASTGVRGRLLKTSIANKRARVEQRLDDTLNEMGWQVSPAAAAAAAGAEKEAPYTTAETSDDTPATSSSAPATSSKAAAAPAATSVEQLMAPVRDEILDAAPRLAAHIKAPAKFLKVAEMAATLLEEGRVTLANSSAFFKVLAAGVEGVPREVAARIRKPELRAGYRRLYAVAVARGGVFPPHLQQQLRLWQLRVLTQIELFTSDTERFTAAVKDVRMRLHQLPCRDPSHEPPLPPGTWREYLPEGTRAQWVCGIFECLEVAMARHKQPWATAEVNMLVKLASDRRQNFSEEQLLALLKWEAQRKASLQAGRAGSSVRA